MIYTKILEHSVAMLKGITQLEEYNKTLSSCSPSKARDILEGEDSIINPKRPYKLLILDLKKQKESCTYCSELLEQLEYKRTKLKNLVARTEHISKE